VFTVLFVGGVAVATALAGGDTFPSPFGSAATAASYFRDHRDAVRVSAFMQFAAAVPLAIYAATVSTRLRNYGTRVPGATIALVGGVLAATMLALSGLLCWVLSRVEVTDSTGAFRVFHDLSFATGGVAHVVFLGLLVAGVVALRIVLDPNCCRAVDDALGAASRALCLGPTAYAEPRTRDAAP
jgi:hypothetical protein